MLCLVEPHLFICPVEHPSYNLLHWEIRLLNWCLSQSVGLASSQVFGGAVGGES